MSTMSKDRHLTEPNPKFEQLVRQTPHGMAHWSGTGPAGTTCGGCQHFGYWYDAMRKRGEAWVETRARKERACALFYKQMHRHPHTALPEETRSCKYFEPKKP
jgi:hypothetical protein